MYDFGFSQNTHMLSAKSYVEILNFKYCAYDTLKIICAKKDLQEIRICYPRNHV